MKLRKLLRRTYYGTKVKIVTGVEDSVKVLVDDYTLECGKQNVPIMYAANKVEAIRIDSDGTLIIYVEDNRLSMYPYISSPEALDYKSTECCQVTHSPGKDESI